YINSAWFGFASRIQSIRQAVVLLGQREIRRWVSLMTMRDLSQDKPAELLTTAVVRGRLCEQIARLAGHPQEAASAFVVGMFSLLDALLDRQMEDIIPELSLAPEVATALQGETTFLGKVLGLSRAYEQAEWEIVAAWCEKLAVDEAKIPGLYQEAVRWADFANEA
ncbi:MAG TPA: HDOD domain-containing protein, partial [Negativicutes bacterium]|nr:HDOD domain-containing protein [Negativicutes bacterium]